MADIKSGTYHHELRHLHLEERRQGCLVLLFSRAVIRVALFGPESSKHATPCAARSFQQRLISGNTADTHAKDKAVKTPMSPAENLRLLNEQRAVRPTSPHLRIYKYLLNMYTSISNRITGAALPAGLYVGALAYLAIPDAATLFTPGLVDIVSSLPDWAKVAGKFTITAPFTFHTFEGLRHLVWDSGYLLTLDKSQKSGYVTLGMSAATDAYLAGLGVFY